MNEAPRGVASRAIDVIRAKQPRPQYYYAEMDACLTGRH